MHVSRSPTARWTSAAATAESTPPDRAQMTLPSVPAARAWASTRSRISLTVESMKLLGVHVWVMPAMPTTKLRSTWRPAGRVDDLRVELDAVQVARRVDEARVRRRIGLGRGVEALRQPGDGVAVAHPDRLLALDAREQAVVRGDGHGRRAVLAAAGRQHVAAQAEWPSAARRSRCPGPGCGRSRWRCRDAGHPRRRPSWGRPRG